MPSEKELTSVISSLVEKGKEDIPFLDALYQWVMSPTSKSAIWHLTDESLFKYISENLEVRYPQIDVKKTMKNLKKSIEEISSLYPSARLEKENLYPVRKKLKKETGRILENVERGRIAESKLKSSIYFLAKSKIKRIWLGFLGVDELNKFRLMHKAALGEIVKLKDLIKIGVLNKHLWKSSGSGAKYVEYRVPDFFKSYFDDIDKFLKPPSLPDAEKYVNFLFDERKIEGLKALDNCLNTVERAILKGEPSYEKCSHVVPRSKIVVKDAKGVAISPLLVNKVKKALKKRKEKERKELVEDLYNIHRLLKEELEPEGSVKFEFKEDWDCYFGKFHRRKEEEWEELNVMVSNWINDPLAEWIEKNKYDFQRKYKKSLLIFTTTQSLSSTIEDIFHLSPVELDKKIKRKEAPSDLSIQLAAVKGKEIALQSLTQTEWMDDFLGRLGKKRLQIDRKK